MNQVLTYAALLGVFAVLFVLGRLILNHWSRTEADNDTAVLAGAGNMAVALRHGSFYIALGIALISTIGLTGQAGSWGLMLVEEFGWGLGILGALTMSLWVNERFVLPLVNNSEALGEGNEAVGVVEAGSLLGTAFIMTGTLHGSGPVVATVVFFVLGQMLMLTMVRLYDWSRPVDYQAEVGSKRNLAAAVLLFGKIVAISLVIRNAITGSSTGWISDLTGSLVSFAVGFAALAGVEYLVDRVLFPGVNVDEMVRSGKAAPMVLLAAISIATALFVTAVSPY